MVGSNRNLKPKPKVHLDVNVCHKAIETKDGQTIWLTSIGKNEKGEQVSEMQFEWTIKVRN